MMKYPPFCPSASCEQHRTPGGHWYWKNGYFTTIRGKSVQRFRCKSCGKQFSESTYSLDYYTQHRLPYRQILYALISGSGLRALSRRYRVSHKVICNRAARLARQSLALTAALREDMALDEDVAADGFESFVGSQYFPNNIHILVGKDSQFLFTLSYAHLRRKGRMRAEQKMKRQRIESELEKVNYSPRKIYISFLDLCDQLSSLIQGAGSDSVTLFTDEHQEYKRALLRHPRLQHFFSTGRFSHLCESSRTPRTPWNTLFSPNYLDREFRKGQANHVRQTVQFSRSVNSCMDRMLVHQLYHNYLKPFRVGKKEYRDVSHAEMAGIKRKKIRSQLKTVFTRRRFLSRIHLPFHEAEMWLRGLETPLKASNERTPAFVFS